MFEKFKGAEGNVIYVGMTVGYSLPCVQSYCNIAKMKRNHQNGMNNNIAQKWEQMI